ncbi:copper tolerance protein [Bradyrhizobium sp. SSBR45G]|uniref:cupredoxin domain-containing protein n=1 Tax=unclassified Bradyrhizobium TaxID=2631580 RepID=UPI002342BC67|nr:MULTISPECIES: cupredoxin family protein [unclassified Bradyrhizobium]GLH78547.1 copper tolerance protein [Bradyrhizobium sp. SSBR45G]GLH86331.1 copper tolerance protein [Bradyrhizobium sp. SSBR45R]
MKTGSAIGAAAAAALMLIAPTHGHEQHGPSGYSAGEPGDAKQPSRTIEVLLSEMEFAPARIEVKRGEQIRFVLRNTGKEDHEFLLATKAENLKHAAVMKKHPHMEHDEPNGVRLAPNKTAELVWRFTKAGTFEYSCLIPDHRTYGMTGHVTVK